MKGFPDKPNYIIELLEGGVTLEDVIDGHICEQDQVEKSAFVVGDLGALMRQHTCWQSMVPQVQPYYPVKCNSSPAVIEVLASLGLGFVCANKAEVSLVLEHGVPPENIILSSAFKQLAHIKYAAKNGVLHLVCENEAELSKIARLHPEAKLLLQLTTEAHAAETSMPFGFSLKSCRHLLEMAKELGVQVVGAAFHIPSSCQDPQQAYTHALSDARCVFDMGVSVESAVRPLLDAYFPQRSGVQVLAQPGCFYVASAFTLAVSVIGKEVVTCRWDSLSQGEMFELFLLPFLDTEFLYYMNEGVYGSFSHKLLGNIITTPLVHKHALCVDKAVYPSSLWGPSLDQLDQVVERCLLPELLVGDWLLFSNMGTCGLEEFSCVSTCSQLPVYYTISTPDWYEMQEAGVALDSAMKNFSVLQYSV
uniref:Antizyme inhibitor 1b n=1 Tax=Poecilia reticulata TaxID=8081 RepID=A0A3P9NLC2_POERE